VKLINITQENIIEAKKLSEEMGKLNNSITKGKGNIHGFLGEIISANFLNVNTSNTYDYDIVFNDIKIDVKTKRVNTSPKNYYECSIADLNTKQKCDVYIFTRILNDMTKGWLLGYINKKDYFEKATFLTKGSIDPSNNWKVSTDCYNLPINKLKDIDNLKYEKEKTL